jgi:Mce-associated membrane protein
VSRENPRRPSSSRAPVSRPRRVAGQGSAPAEGTQVEPVETTDAETPDLLEPAPDVVAGSRGLSALFESRRVTRILVTLVVVLALAAGGLLIWDAVSSDDQASPSKQPVVISGDDATEAVAAAAKSAETIVATSYQDYDDQVDEATALMTDAFAKQYRQTAEDIKPDFVEAKTDIQVQIVAQGVVHATRTEVQALLFLNQYVSKDGGDTTYTPYRALVTVVHTDRGWLVSNLDTK